MTTATTSKTSIDDATEQSATISSSQGLIGQRIDDLVVEIDYDIIEHFSQHLYSSPNKAVEELVSNSFDAFASSTYVYIPGSFTDETVLVWDDGLSMNVHDLKRLWWIAQSPKEQIRGRVAASNEGLAPRALIGKFGIGKLASYAVGDRITHLCRRDSEFLLVRVSYVDVPHLDEGNVAERYSTPILKLSEDEADAFVKSLFRADASPKAFAEIWSKNHWTLAVIDQLKDSSKLTVGRLAWVIGSGMPLRPDFHVWVNDSEVEPKLGHSAGQKLTFADEPVKTRLTSEWSDAKAAGGVDGEFVLDGAAAEFPTLGNVKVLLTIFDDSQKERATKDDPRSHGFFIMVRGRLINPNDELLFLPAPSYGTFYRCQFVIEADGLDEVLLADRERLMRDTPQAAELVVLQRALYMAGRDEVESRDTKTVQRQRPEHLLPVDSRQFFREPLNTLLLQRDIPLENFPDVGATRIERVAHAGDDPLSLLDTDGAFHVNSAHPLFQSVRKLLGGSAAARKAFQIFDALAVTDVLLEGSMLDIGVPQEQIAKVMRWRDGLLREVASRFETAPIDEVVREAYEQSYKGGRPFERALIKLFRQMGFRADHDGASGQWDGLVVAPVGMDYYRFTVEAKGSKGKVVNDAAEVSGAAAHRKAADAKFAVIVAREFAGFSEEDADPAVLKECRATGDVSIVTIRVLDELHAAINAFHYPLDMVSSVLSEIEAPSQKLARVRALRHPTEAFDYQEVLRTIWTLQQEEAKGDLVPYRTVWQRGPNKWGVTFEDFERRLLALSQLAGDALLRVSTSPEKVTTLKQDPMIVADHIAVTLQSLKADQVMNDSE